MNKNKSNVIRLYFSLILLSISIIAYQLVLIQILSIIQWYHFAYMIISIALLGFGAAGTFISLFKKRLIEKVDVLLPWLMIATSLLMVLSAAVAQSSLLSFDSYKIFTQPSHLLKLAANYLIFFLPFFFGALSIGLIFVKYVEKIGSLYSANMIGSGIGGLIIVFAMWWFFPEKLTAVVSTIALAAGLIAIPKRMRGGFTFVLTTVVAVLSYFYIDSPSLNISEYKSISKSLNLPESKIIQKVPSPYGLLNIIYSPHIRYAPGLSIKYTGNVSITNAVFNNGNWYGPVVSLKQDSLDFLEFTTENFPFVISKRNEVLVLGAGTGRQIALAIKNNVSRVVAVEQNKAATNLLMEELAGETGSVFRSNEVRPQNISPRTFLKKNHSHFDLIAVPLTGTFGGTAGLFALQEQYELTVESFSEMWGSLKDDGVIVASTWIDYPYRKPLKLLSTIVEMMELRGIQNPGMHITAIKNWNAITFAVKRTPFNEEEVKLTRQFCSNLNFDPVILPGIISDERDKFNKLQNSSFYELIDRILESPEERARIYSEYSFNIKPATDDKPYFSRFLLWKSFNDLSKLFGSRSLPFFELGYILLYLTFLQIIIIAFLLIVVPLFKLRLKGGISKTLFYFGGLGTGYMFIEIILIQRFTLYFGNVIYSVAAIVGLMLVSSGIGSLVSQKMRAKPNRITGVILLIIISIIIYSITLSSLLNTTIIFSMPVKIIFTAFLIAPPAFLMGMPFPLGLRLLALNNEQEGKDLVPWAWGINGVFSVISTVLATIIAIELGFVWVMIFAIGAYGLSIISKIVKY